VKQVGVDIAVLDYAEHALSSGGDATAAAYVECAIGDQILWGVGIDPSISNEALKSQYRKLVADNHPDKLMARGVPKEFVAIATEKIAVINEAYGEIAKERGI